MNRINNIINIIKYKISYVNEKQSIPSVLYDSLCIIEYMKNSLWFIVGPMRHSQRFSFAKPLAVSHWRRGVRRRGLFSFFLSSPPFLLPSSSLPLSFPSFFFSLFLFIAPQGSYTVYIPKIENLEGLYKKKEVKWEDLTN